MISWISPCRPPGKSCHENTSTRRWRTSPSAWLPTWLWLPMLVTSSICSNYDRLQVFILISSPTNQFFSEPLTDYHWRQRSECWEWKIRSCLDWKSISLSFSDTLQPNLVHNFVQKLHTQRKYGLSTKVAGGGGFFICVHSVDGNSSDLSLRLKLAKLLADRVCLQQWFPHSRCSDGEGTRCNRS